MERGETEGGNRLCGGYTKNTEDKKTVILSTKRAQQLNLYVTLANYLYNRK